jgi:hypothetical protein
MNTYVFAETEGLSPRRQYDYATRRRNSRLVSEALTHNAWDFDSNLSIDVWAECIRLWEAIDMVHRDNLQQDTSVSISRIV